MLQERPNHRLPLGPALLDVMGEAGSDEAALLAELRAVIDAVETPAGRMRARYRGWPSRRATIYGRYRD
jgi:hypothetical protein